MGGKSLTRQLAIRARISDRTAENASWCGATAEKGQYRTRHAMPPKPYPLFQEILDIFSASRAP